MLLFICHVSEDKVDFVEPLAIALREEFEVWYDKFELTLGDSLRHKIDQGLSNCDFGVVVLSKAFFAKKRWAQAELDALYTLEVQFGKIILPILKDLSIKEFSRLSPLLAGKITVSATEGLKRVLEEIRLAVRVSQRKGQVTTLANATESVRAVEQTLAQIKYSSELLNSLNGVGIVLNSVADLYHGIENTLRAVGDSSDVIEFTFKKLLAHDLLCRTVLGLYLSLRVRDISEYSASLARLEIKIFQRQFNEFGESVGTKQDFKEIVFHCRIPSESNLIWEHKPSKLTYDSNTLAAYLVEEYMTAVRLEIEANKDKVYYYDGKWASS
jgi:DNA-binding FrmR family transcriptional regulator